MTESTKLYSLGFDKAKTYGFVALFVVGSVLLPQLCHLIPNGGAMLLPIYFFTLIAAYKYGLIAGLLTAVLSPVVNYLLFRMPPAIILPIMLIESIVLAVVASEVAKRLRRVSILGIMLAVISYKFVGMIMTLAVTGLPNVALNGVVVGIPGMMLQLFGGYLLMKYVLKK